MPGALKFSEAFVLGLHATALISKNSGDKISVAHISDDLKCSFAHLQKILQRLVKAGIIGSTRGPKGGYVLARDAQHIKLLDIYEAIEGQFKQCSCLFDTPVCQDNICILGTLTEDVNTHIWNYFTKNSIADISNSQLPNFVSIQNKSEV